MQNLDRFRGKFEARIEGLAVIVQSEHGLVFGEERAEEIEFRAEILRSIS